MTKQSRAAALLLALAASAAFSACGSGEEESGATERASTAGTTANEARGGYGKKKQSPAVPTIAVRNGEPVGGVRELEYDAGDEVRFRVSSNRADEVHVHGYDVEKEIPAGGSATVSFPAEIEGIFEVELHESEAQIVELRVNP